MRDGLTRKSATLGSRSLSLYKYEVRAEQHKGRPQAMNCGATKVERFGEESINVCISLQHNRKER